MWFRRRGQRSPRVTRHQLKAGDLGCPASSAHSLCTPPLDSHGWGCEPGNGSGAHMALSGHTRGPRSTAHLHTLDAHPSSGTENSNCISDFTILNHFYNQVKVLKAQLHHLVPMSNFNLPTCAIKGTCAVGGPCLDAEALRRPLLSPGAAEGWGSGGDVPQANQKVPRCGFSKQPLPLTTPGPR